MILPVLFHLNPQVLKAANLLHHLKAVIALYRHGVAIVHYHLNQAYQVFHQRVVIRQSHQGVHPVIALYQASPHGQATVPSQVNHPHRTVVYRQSVHNHHGVVTQATVPSRQAVLYLYPRSQVTHHYQANRPNQVRQKVLNLLTVAIHPIAHCHPNHLYRHGVVYHHGQACQAKAHHLSVPTVRNRLYRHRVVKVRGQV